MKTDELYKNLYQAATKKYSFINSSTILAFYKLDKI